VGTPLTVADRLVPCDCEYRFPSPGTVETHSQYSTTPVPLVQLNVTVEDVSTDPGAGATICASTTAPGVLVTVGGRVPTGVGVLAGVGLMGGVPAGVGGAAGVDVTTPGPYG